MYTHCGVFTLYGHMYIAVICSSHQGPRFSSEVLLYHLLHEGRARLAHILNMDIPGCCTLSVVDNLIVIHHQASKTSTIYNMCPSKRKLTLQVKVIIGIIDRKDKRQILVKILLLAIFVI